MGILIMGHYIFGASNLLETATPTHNDDHHQPKTKSAHRCRQIIIVFNLHWNGLMIPIPQYWLLVMSPLCHYEKVIVYPWHMDEIFVKSSTIKTPFHPGDESLWKWTKCSHPGIFFHNFQWPYYSMNLGLKQMCLEIIYGPIGPYDSDHIWNHLTWPWHIAAPASCAAPRHAGAVAGTALGHPDSWQDGTVEMLFFSP